MNTALDARPRPSAPATAAFWIGIVYLALRKIGSIGDSDVWWHLRTGDLIRTTGSVPSTDPFSWTAAGEPWQPNAWMSDVFFSWLRDAGGWTALSLYRSVGVILIGVLLRHVLRQRGASAWTSVGAVFLGLLLMMPFITERPQVLGFMAFATMMIVLPAAAGGSRAAIISVGVLIAIWANLHGSFIIGVGVVGLVALGSGLAHRRWCSPTLVVILTVLAPLAHPYGVGVYKQALSIPGVSTFIEEWRAFDLTDVRDQLIGLFTVIALFGMWRGERWKSWDSSLTMVALIALTAGAIRAAPFLLMWGAPFFALALSSLGIPRLRSWAAPRFQPLGVGLMIAGVVLVGSQLGQIAQTGSIDSEQVPVGQVDGVPTGCRLLNEYEFGGFIIDRRWPDLLVSQDGRNDVYGLERIELQESWLESDDITPLDEAGITCVLARPSRPLATALRSETSWSILSESELAVAFTRNDY